VLVSRETLRDKIRKLEFEYNHTTLRFPIYYERIEKARRRN